MKVALAQINPTVGDLSGNLRKIRNFTQRAAKKGAELVVFPELCVTGYPPRDLVEQPGFVENNRRAVQELAARIRHPAILVGFVDVNTRPGEKNLRNAAALLHGGQTAALRAKSLLPDYDVFDEFRHFAPAASNEPVRLGADRLGLTICEDMWHVPSLWAASPYQTDPVEKLGQAGVDFFINISCSPFQRGKTSLRLELIRHHARRFARPFLFVNQVGGNDELIFDGNSLAVDAEGRILAQAESFAEDLICVETRDTGLLSWREASDIAQIRDALVLGLRDYAGKCGFSQVVLGLSGGIDSAVTAALAVEALGKNNVLGVSMPSRWSSKGSVEDAAALSKNLGIRSVSIPIAPIFSQFLSSLKKPFAGRPPDVTEENLQARIRGTLLMALSNKFGRLLLTTGNKSELSMGYCTL